LRVLHRRVEFEPGWTFPFHFITDTHLGSYFCDEETLTAKIAEISADPFCLWGFGGDAGEYINRSDKRHKESAVAKWLHGRDDLARHQLDKIVATFEPAQEQGLWWGKGNHEKGNHEEVMLTKYERNVYQESADALGMSAMGIQGFFIILWTFKGRVRAKTVIYTHHGHGGGLLSGADALMLGRLPTYYRFDLAFIGHRHRKHWVPNTYVDPQWRGRKPVCKHQHMLLGGSFMHTFDEAGEVENYPELLMLPPKAVGSVKVLLSPTFSDGVKMEVVPS
jgi:hypothetical protein